MGEVESEQPPRSDPAGRAVNQPPLLLIQIDGLSKTVLERRMEAGDLPALESLADRNESAFIPICPGVPSTTPAVQAELFYGVRQAVPAFAFMEGRTTARHMIDPPSAARLEERLEREHRGLLEGGSSYCNIYTGGAVVSRFTPGGIGRPGRAWRFRIRTELRSIGGYISVAAQSLVMLGGEVIRAIVPPRRHTKATPIRERVSDSWGRIFASIVLRDHTRRAAKHDLREGLPIVCVNFLGYDKQAHRYGPRSRPAGRALKGIDVAIGLLVRDAERRTNGRVRAVVYSDHGQEDSRPLRDVAGRDIEDIVRETVDHLPDSVVNADAPMSKGVDARPSMKDALAERIGEQLLGIEAERCADQRGRTIATMQSGPIAHVYVEPPVDPAYRLALARGVAGRATGVAALLLDDRDDVAVALALGEGDAEEPELHSLRDFIEERLADHPYRKAVAADLESLVRHRDAGDLVLLAMGCSGEPLTFADEHGSHGGIGPEEMNAFVILPNDLTLERSAPGDHPRFIDLRRVLLGLRGLDDRRSPGNSQEASA